MSRRLRSFLPPPSPSLVIAIPVSHSRLQPSDDKGQCLFRWGNIFGPPLRFPVSRPSLPSMAFSPPFPNFPLSRSTNTALTAISGVPPPKRHAPPFHPLTAKSAQALPLFNTFFSSRLGLFPCTQKCPQVVTGGVFLLSPTLKTPFQSTSFVFSPLCLFGHRSYHRRQPKAPSTLFPLGLPCPDSPFSPLAPGIFHFPPSLLLSALCVYVFVCCVSCFSSLLGRIPISRFFLRVGCGSCIGFFVVFSP